MAHPHASNRVRSRREERGLTQAALAEAAGISRQSLSAIEAGRSAPAVQLALRIAITLGSNVEELFGESSRSATLEAELVPGSAPAREAFDLDRSPRVALAFLRERWLAYPLTAHTHTLIQAAHGLARPHAAAQPAAARQRSHVQVELLRPLAAARETVVLSGCAPALGVLAQALNAERGPGRFMWLEQSSAASMKALKHGQVHLAGVHLHDGRDTEPNAPAVRRSLPKTDLLLVTLASWQAGLCVRAGNPLRIRSIADLGRARVRIVAREPGAGARALLQQQLQAAQLPAALLDKALIVHGQLDVGRAIALGAADVGLAMEAAALAFGLDFLPLAQERFDLVVPRAMAEEASLIRLFDTLNGSAFRRELANLGGYDAAQCGTRAADIRAA